MYLQIEENFDDNSEKAEYFDVSNNEKLVSFGPISTVNLFVGANNSGKSRFLRNTLKRRSFLSIAKKANLASLVQKIIDTLNVKSFSLTRPLQIKATAIDFQPFIVYFDSYPILKKHFIEDSASVFGFETQLFTDIKAALEEYVRTLDTSILKSKIIDKFSTLIAFNEFLADYEGSKNLPLSITVINLDIFKQIKDFYEKLLPLYELSFEYLPSELQRAYIPILRTSYSLYLSDDNTNKIDSDIFKSTVAIHYDIKKLLTHGVEIFTGLDLYNQIKKYRNSLKDKRSRFETFEKFIGKTFFNDVHFEIIARGVERNEEKHINVLIHGEENDIHFVGDGIQSLILVMFPIFMAEPNTWFFIEEPEINLHPAMQRIFLEQLTKSDFLKKKNLKYFITTHSNHLLDLSLEMDEEVSIFTFNKTTNEEGFSRFNIKNVKSGNTEILDLLGVKTSSVFLANCTLWVEGITDRYYIREFLRAYHVAHPKAFKYKEDLNYAFFEYAGNNIEHYLFGKLSDVFDTKELKQIKTKFLSNKIYLIADKDKGKEKRHLGLLKKENDNFDFEVLSVLEIENLLSEKELTKFLPVIYRKFSTKSVDFSSLDFKTYKALPLGKYLKEVFPSIDIEPFVADSGTIATTYKLKLAIKAKDNITWDEMSKPAKDLTKNIYDFIKKSNA